MDKHFITYNGIEYPVRTVTLPEDFFEMAGQKVDVADVELYHAYEVEYEKGDKHANAIDESIYYFCDSGFVASDPSDEEIVNYLVKNVV